MGGKKYVGKIKLGSAHVEKIVQFAKKLLKLSQTERLLYLENIKNNEIDLISEIVLNFLRCNIKSDSESKSILERVKKYLYILASKRKSISIKKKILKSLKGLNILNILLPLALKVLIGV